MAKRSRDGNVISQRQITGVKRAFEMVSIGPCPKKAREHEYWHHALLTREERAKRMNTIYTRLLQLNA